MNYKVSDFADYSQEKKDEKFRYAIIAEDLNKAEALRLAGANIDSTSERGYSGIFLAANNNRKKSFAYLLDRGCNVNIQDSNKETLLMHLIRTEKRQLIDYLLKVAAQKIDFELSNKFGITALIMAAIYKDSVSIEKMFQANPSINVHARTEQKATAILAASSNYDIKSIKILLANGANIHDTDYYGKDCLLNAIMNIDKQQVKKAKDAKNPHGIPDMNDQGTDDTQVDNSTDEEKLREKMQGDYLETIQFLIDNNANVNYRSKSGITPLFAACYYDLSGLGAETLLNAGADPKVLHSQMVVENISPLGAAMETGKIAIATKILEKMTKEEAKEWLNKPNSIGNSPAAYGFLHPKLRPLNMEFGADPNTIINLNGERFPALSFILSQSDGETFDLMVAKGAKLSYQDQPEFELYEPLKLGIASGSPTILEKIAKYPGIDLNKPLKISKEFETTPLSFLMTNSNSRMLETFMKQKKAIESMMNQKMGDGSNAYKLPEENREALKGELNKLKQLEEELTKNRQIMIDVLLDNGAKINQKDKYGRTALFYITEPEYIEVMLQKGADFFIQDNEGNNALSFAIKNNAPIASKWLEYVIENNLAGHEQIQNLLIDIAYTTPNSYYAQSQLKNGLAKSISPGSSLLDKQDKDGNTPLIIMAATRQTSGAATIIDLGADVNISNKLGETALMHAIGNKNPDLVKFLVEKGADLKAKTKAKKSVMDFAEEVGDKEILATLKNKLNPGAAYSSGKRIIK